ncbi:MAG TPA: glycoside hydrolase family 2, partial [Candidatus Paceibacterota bacterium]|nr:glycoside hydrolase family 2 [Candidatus Paceibacterota bacterium]
ARVADGKIQMAGGNYRVVVVPQCERMPEQTLGNLLALAKAGATVIFERQLPKDIPGLGNLEHRQAQLKQLFAEARELAQSTSQDGHLLVNKLGAALKIAGAPREALFDQPGLMCIRRAVEDGRFYFLANRGDKAFEGWLPIANAARSVVIMSPANGETGLARSRAVSANASEVYLQLAPGESTILRVFPERKVRGRAWQYWKPQDPAVSLNGRWQVRFLQGGPELPAPFSTETLASWTTLGDTNAQRFAGTALYSLKFDAPETKAKSFRLDLGNVCQSARVRLNGKEFGTLITPPFRVAIDKLKSRDNLLEVEVTNVSANRIRDLDRRGVNWKIFRDINVVNIDYKPFDASDWPLTDSGLLGPVTLTPGGPE